MALSIKTTQNLAIALTPEVIDYIYADERWFDFMVELTSDAIRDKLGTEDTNLISELGACVLDNIVLRACQMS
jgi:hypothetical protein